MEKMRFKSFLAEGINDRGIFKAIFIGGIPGSGKSYTVSQITDGTVQPRIVNTDKMLQFMSAKHDTELSKEFTASEIFNSFLDTSKHLTQNQLSHYLDGMLPLIIDSTSNSIDNTLRRAGLLESMGYDVGMVWVNTSLETSVARAAKRDRHVDPEFIKHVYSLCDENKSFFKSKFDFFLEINNDDGELTTNVINNAYNDARKFFAAPVSNPVGKRKSKQLRHSGQSTLIPSIYSKAEIDRIVTSWY